MTTSSIKSDQTAQFVRNLMPSEAATVLFNEVVESCKKAALNDRDSIRFSSATQDPERFNMITEVVYSGKKTNILAKAMQLLADAGFTVKERYSEGQFVDMDEGYVVALAESFPYSQFQYSVANTSAKDTFKRQSIGALVGLSRQMN